MANLEEKLENEEIGRVYADKTDLDRRIYSVAGNTIEYYIKHVFPEAFEIIKQKKLFSADIEYQIKKLSGETGLKHKIYPLIDPTHDTFVANLDDSELSATIVERVEGNEELKEEAQFFYDWSESMSNINSTEDKMKYEGSLLGTTYAMLGTRENLTYEKSVFITPLVDQNPNSEIVPNCEHISFFELFCEPGCKEFENSRYKIRRQLLTLRQIHELYHGLIDFNEKKETNQDGEVELDVFIEKTSGSCLYGRDFNRIRQINDYTDVYKCKLDETNADRNLFNVGMYEDMFKVIIDEGGMHEVIEYWSGTNLAIMINGYVLYDGDNPYGNQDPFACAVYEEGVGSYRGTGIGHKLMPLQKEANMLYSSINNGIKMHIFPDYAITKGMLKDSSGNEINQMIYKGGKVYEIPVGNTLTGEPFRPIHFMDKDVLSLAIRRLQEVRLEGMEVIGTNSYTQGGQGKVERSASAVSAKVATLRSRLNSIVRSLNKFRQKSFYTWMYICNLYFPEGLKARIINKDEGTAKFMEITPSELMNKFDIFIDRETAVSIRRGEAIANTIQTLNALGPFLVDQNGMPTLDIRDTLKKMLGQSMLQNVKVLDEEGIKEMMDLRIGVEQYVAEQSGGMQQQSMGPQQPQMGPDELRDVQASIGDRGAQLPPDIMEQLGL